jgi:hypothetical protein
MNDASKLAGFLMSPKSGRGDWIPDTFKKVFVNNRGVDLPTCHVFSKILYWHSLSHKGKKRYKGGKLSLSVHDLSKQIKITKSQVRAAVEKLEHQYQVIHREKKGRRILITLDVEKIKSLFTPFLQDSSEDSEEGSRLRSNSNKTSLVCAQTQTYIHKGEINYFPEEKKETFNEYSEEFFIESCKAIFRCVKQRTSSGDTTSDIHDFLLNPNHSKEQYPAFARVWYLHTHCPDEVATLDTREIENQLRLECSNDPNLFNMMKKHCPGFELGGPDPGPTMNVHLHEIYS